MECEEILQIQQKLQALCDALSATVPVAELHAHPFTANGKKIGRIVAFIGQITEQALEERKALEDENLKLEDKIYLYCEQLSLDRPTVERAHNVCLQRVYLENELGRINAIRSGVESEVNMLLAEIKKAREWLGHPAGDEGGAEISLAALDYLRSRLALLAEEKAQKEAKRQSYYDEIEECNRVLKIETRFLFDESICLLEAMAAQARAAIQLGRAEHARLAADIQKRAAYLKIKPEQFSDSVDAENLRAMGEYCQRLRAEQSRLFDTIFEKVRLELAAINEIFGIDMPDHPATEESLDMMRDAIADLLPKKYLHSSKRDSFYSRR